MPPRESQGRQVQIDSLRAIGITSILYTHFWNGANPFGQLGIRLFFIISGFLITGILLRIRQSAEVEGADIGRSLLNFYVRRALRIWPIYYGALALALLVEQQRIVPSLPWHMLFASNILFASKNAWDPWFTSHFWTLSIEEQFYLLWPLFILFAPRVLLPRAMLAIVLIGVTFNATSTLVHLDNPGIAVLTPGAFDTLGIGALLALKDGRWTWPSWLSHVAAACAIFWLAFNIYVVAGHARNVYAEVLANMFVLIPLAGVAKSVRAGLGGGLGALLNFSPLRYVGRISYGIYVYHIILLGIALTFLPDYFRRGPFTFFCLGLATVAVAALSWAFIEKPILRLRDKFPYRAIQRSAA